MAKVLCNVLAASTCIIVGCNDKQSPSQLGSSGEAPKVSGHPQEPFPPIFEKEKSGEHTIMHGKPTCSWEAIGELRLNDRSHCTGTLIGAKTVLTSGHCLDDRYNNLKLTFRIGCGFLDGRPGVVAVATYRAPRYRFGVPGHDIGLICLAAPRAEQTFSAMGDAPNSGEVLTFVGFGYDAIDGGFKTGIGEKRTTNLRVDRVEATLFTTKVEALASGNTCNGDSGGPAFRAGSQLIVGLTSDGDRDPSCSDNGRYTRLDDPMDQAWIRCVADFCERGRGTDGAFCK